MKETNRTQDKKNRGSLTVEAVLFLIPFMMAFLTLINAARFVEAEVIVHHAITQTAKQISTYSYVLTKSKISSHIQGTHKKSEKFKTSVDGAIDSVQNFANAVGNVGSSGDLAGDLHTAVDAGSTAGKTLTDFFSDPKAIVTGVFQVAKSEGEGFVLANIAGALARSNIKKSIVMMSDDPDAYLTNIGIIGGLSGLDFLQSKWISTGDGKADIKIVVTYKMKNLLFPDFDFGQHEFCQCASTLIW